MKKLLIISNNVLSKTSNNGKTLYSLIKNIPPANVSQLYFHGNSPEIHGYNYYQISDRDIIKGYFKRRNRGRAVTAIETKTNNTISNSRKNIIKRSSVVLTIRDLLWWNSWKSSQLDDWLEQVSPSYVLFMAGDTLYSYWINKYIVNRFGARLITFITDDYVLPRSQESIIDKKRRLRIIRYMRDCISMADKVFYISEKMQSEYVKLFGVKGSIYFNMPDSLYDEGYAKESYLNKSIVMMYAGSLYYGRDHVLLTIKDRISDYNESASGKTIELRVYSNQMPSTKYIQRLESSGDAVYGGSLNADDLKRELNKADVLVFVESFEKEQIEKTRLSLSTKIPEYLSLGKPILAVGPEGIGSIEYLNDCSVCVNTINNIEQGIREVVNAVSIRQDKNIDKYNEAKRIMEHNCNLLRWMTESSHNENEY